MSATEVSAGSADARPVKEMLAMLRQRVWRVVGGTVLVAALTAGVTFLIPPTFTATTTFLPPQQQSGASAALAALGPLAGLAGGVVGTRTPADQYVALMRSVTVADRIIDQFELMRRYDKEYRIDARKRLEGNVRIAPGKKDGLITVEVDDRDPKVAAAMANRYVDELRRMTNGIALTEAQQRRMFFERQMRGASENLAKAQASLLASGIDAATLKAEPKSAAEGYARLRAEATAASVRLQALQGTLTDNAPEVRSQRATLGALQAEIAKLEKSGPPVDAEDYVGRYREFKYYETLYELFARQYELARVDESREGGLIQVVDVALPPEKKSAPKRIIITLVATLAALVLLSGHAMLSAPVRPRSSP